MKDFFFYAVFQANAFSYEFYEIFKHTIFTEHLRMTDSGNR